MIAARANEVRHAPNMHFARAFVALTAHFITTLKPAT
jgi:hypothetical protein